MINDNEIRKKKLKFNLLTAFLFLAILGASWFCYAMIVESLAQKRYDEFCRTARLLPTTVAYDIEKEVRALRMPEPEDESF